jgi:predicted house-cleaning NTP pyrophosphatase (Maf/HAM1 superfamily)
MRTLLMQMGAATMDRVIQAVALVRPGHAPRVVCRRSRVRFRPLTAEAIDAYVRAVDPRDKAGGYDIGERGELLVAGCRGSRTNVMGLPIEEVLPWWNRLRARASPP